MLPIIAMAQRSFREQKKEVRSTFNEELITYNNTADTWMFIKSVNAIQYRSRRVTPRFCWILKCEEWK
jgi:hypothetical protein